MASLADLIRKLDSFTDVTQYAENDLLSLWNDTIRQIKELAPPGSSNAPVWDNYRKQKASDVKNKGNEALTSGKNNIAALWFTLSILLDDSNYVYFSNRSAAFANLGRYHEALQDAQQTVNLNPGWAKGYSRKGLACFFLKKYDEALDAYRKGLQIEPNNDSLKQGITQVQSKVEAADANEKGEQLIAKGKYPEAVAAFEKATTLDPVETAYFANRSHSYILVGQYPKALECADQSIRLRPDWVKGWRRRAEALIKLDRYDEAAASLTQAYKLEPTSSTLQMEINNVIQEGYRFRMRQQMNQKSAEQQKEEGK